MLLNPDDLPAHRDAIYQLRATNRQAKESGLLETIGRWPERESISAYSSRLLLVHGSPTEPLAVMYTLTLLWRIGTIKGLRM